MDRVQNSSNLECYKIFSYHTNLSLLLEIGCYQKSVVYFNGDKIQHSAVKRSHHIMLPVD